LEPAGSVTRSDQPAFGLAIADPWIELRALTPARIALGRAGATLPTAAQLDFRLAHARARDAVHEALHSQTLHSELSRLGIESLCVRSAAAERSRYLQRPDLGRMLDAASRDLLQQRSSATTSRLDAAFVVADGLSAQAAHRHAVPLLAALYPKLAAENWTLAPVTIAELGRVALGDEIGALLGARLVVVLLGERPGLSSPHSLGAYLTWQPRAGRTDAERNCLSNIRPEGLDYDRAAAKLHFLMSESRRREMSGVGLKDDTGVLGS
jgi:ethanolamine ammonia-lyase small subunit